MKTVATILFLSLLSPSQAWRIRQINLKTSDKDSTAGTDGTIRARFYGCDGAQCETNVLDNFLSNDHELGDLDKYDDEGTLGGCYDLDTKNELCNVWMTAEVQMLNSDDGWLPEYIQFQDDTGAWVVECPLGKWIDDCADCSYWGCCSQTATCYPVAKEVQEDPIDAVRDLRKVKFAEAIGNHHA